MQCFNIECIVIHIFDLLDDDKTRFTFRAINKLCRRVAFEKKIFHSNFDYFDRVIEGERIFRDLESVYFILNSCETYIIKDRIKMFAFLSTTPIFETDAKLKEYLDFIRPFLYECWAFDVVFDLHDHFNCLEKDRLVSHGYLAWHDRCDCYDDQELIYSLIYKRGYDLFRYFLENSNSLIKEKEDSF